MKFITMSFDDGEIQDRQLIELLREYKFTASFGLCCGYLGESGVLNDKRRYSKTAKEEINELYRGFDLCSHGFYHRDFSKISYDMLHEEIGRDIETITALTGQTVRGVIYPGGNAAESRTFRDVLEKLGIKYGRMADCTYNFDIPKDFLYWQPTCHMNENSLFELLDRFERVEGDAVFSVFGHSYELDQKGESRWERLERFFEKVSKMRGAAVGNLFDVYSYFCERN